MKIEQKLEEGIAFHQANLLHLVEQTYQQILQVLPQHADALHLLGVIAYHKDRTSNCRGLNHPSHKNRFKPVFIL